ncbi:P-loop containing nucleoside triphosphate hydrolase protein [Gonapodya prolifera JEL478]|uniref:p-loop containing nucleoside triphosphate hydrolase protein n=1 Tax=Gonapodya prolifera (strain JEL478) TaxID=1344416 RepID=A0A138ZZR0_GONPJ|nr:P-loop containing nucleoside triphosphate hydrolase protein [Gonapodya prolifera JEL478]|eukprot:KXS09989.1 P-loop containing nucleoside triphosphate hydrolase protein [Gonapodya prolifera JEL478]
MDDDDSLAPDVTDLGFFATTVDEATPEETLWGGNPLNDFVPSHLVPDKENGNGKLGGRTPIPSPVVSGGNGDGMDVEGDEEVGTEDQAGPPRKKVALDGGNSGLESRHQPKQSSRKQQRNLPDNIMKLAQNRWRDVEAKGVGKICKKLWDAVVDAEFDHAVVSVVELSEGLEKLLWPHLTASSSDECVLLTALLFLEKLRQDASSAWSSILRSGSEEREADAKRMENLCSRAFAIILDSIRNTLQKSEDQRSLLFALVLVPFITSLLAHLDVPEVRSQIVRVTGVGIWSHVTGTARSEALKEAAHVKKAWERWSKRVNEADPPTRTQLVADAAFLPTLISYSLQLATTHPHPSNTDHLLSHVLDLVVDVLSTVPTRRYAELVVRDSLLAEEFAAATLFTEKRPDKTKGISTLLPLMLRRLQETLQHPIDPLTGAFLEPAEARTRHAKVVAQIQREAFSNPSWKQAYESLAMPGAGKVSDVSYVTQIVRDLPDDLVLELCKLVGVRTQRFVIGGTGTNYGKEFLAKTVGARLASPKGMEEAVEHVGAWPDETSLFTPLTASTPTQTPAGLPTSLPLPLPKVSLQYLSHPDALLRHLHLARIETFAAIRTDMEDAVNRMAPTYNADKGRTTFAGWARMAVPLEDCRISEVGPSRVLGADRKGGPDVPSYVKADVSFTLHRVSDVVRREWDALTPRDVVFLVNCGPRVPEATDPLGRLGIRYIRSAEILDLLDAQGKPVEGWSRAGGTRAYEMETDAGVPDVMPADAPTAPKWRRDDENDNPRKVSGVNRTYRVLLDPIKFADDRIRHPTPVDDPTQTFHSTYNLIVRRKPAENNFKPLLETIRDLVLQGGAGVPRWLQDVYLGYGDVKEVGGFGVEDPIRVVEVAERLGEWKALQTWGEEKGWRIVPKVDNLKTSAQAQNGHELLSPPYVLSFPPSLFTGQRTSSNNPNHLPFTPAAIKAIPSIGELDERDWQEKGSKAKAKQKKERQGKSESSGSEVVVRRYKETNMGPFPEDKRRKNTLQFTPTQIDAILSGIRPGLTLIVGPPGTGKTDVAVQVISSLYHNFPSEQILLVTHSNQALNNLFEKIAQSDIDPRHLLRLGHGEEEIEVQGDWSKYGRVNAFLDKRLRLLAEVEKLKDSLGIPGDYHGTCETAGYFFLFHILTRWDPYWSKVKNVVQEVRRSKSGDEQNLVTKARTLVTETFPFITYFTTALQRPLFTAEMTLDEVVEVAAGCFRHIRRVFDELEEVRAFELLRTNYDRSNYLLVKEARIVAMTCTHAGLKRRELVRLGFKYDSVVMEEAAQVTEVESFIPMALQIPEDDGSSRLRRVVMIGDHHQLPPVVKDISLQRHTNMEQSLFTRFIRLGVPFIELDRQGRARSSITDLYRWRYNNLHDLDVAVLREEYKLANPGFVHEYQLVDVGPFQGKGETEPLPWFYQNLGEAEYVVAVYQYMRLLGYPVEKIAILTTYNGQKELIKDVLQQRCAWNPLFGKPSKVTTVDKYQGQQNDYILLSLVRTRSVGHLRDIRRLIVAMSRARLGLYIFCNKKLFQNCQDLAPTFSKLLERPTKLSVRSGERYGETKRALHSSASGDKTASVFEIQDVEHMGRYVYQMTTEVIAWAKKQKAEREAAEGGSVDVEMGTENGNEVDVDAKIES